VQAGWLAWVQGEGGARGARAGWVVPAYTMAPNAQKIRVLRVLCREDFSMQSAESFVDDLKQALSWLDGHFIYTPQQLRSLQVSMKWQGVARRAIKVVHPTLYPYSLNIYPNP
jgi:hypothetical protein